MPGSHHRLTAEALRAEASEAGCSAGAGRPAALECVAGDAIVYDLRTHHAGGANGSPNERRSVLYYVFGRSWYTADLHRRLLEDEGLVAKEEPHEGYGH